jgi:hypothetical protein
MIPPNITHASCDLEQQQDRLVARRERLARAVALRSGRGGWLARLRGRPQPDAPTADAARPGPSQDVLHALRDC